MSKSISAVINARLASSRVPQKLVRPFAGTCLLDIALNKLNQMDFFEHRFLAAADKEIIEHAKGFGNVKVLRRNHEAVKKGVNPMHVTFAHYKEMPTDYIFVFNPCLPFFQPTTIKRAVHYFQEHDHPSYTSVIETGDWIFDKMGNALTHRDPHNTTTNKGEVFYKGSHAFHIINRNFFNQNGFVWTWSQNDPHMIPVPKEEMIDIDDEVEFEFAEFLYRKKF